MIPRVTSFLLVDSVSGLLVYLQGFWHDQPLKLLGRVLPIFTMWFLFVDDLDYTLSVTAQDIRFVDRRYWSPQISQSGEH